MVYWFQNGRDNPVKPSLEVGKVLGDIVATGRERIKDGVPDVAFQQASRQAAEVDDQLGGKPRLLPLTGTCVP